MRFYAGIGARSAPDHILEKMTNFATRLEKLGFVLRSGGAEGSDKAFQAGVSNPSNKVVYKAKDANKVSWAHDLAAKQLPSDRKNFESWDSYVKNLIARNMMQILGRGGKEPVEFVLCWTPTLDYSTSKCGGTGYAIRLAKKLNIPIINFKDEKVLSSWEEILKDLEKEKDNG